MTGTNVHDLSFCPVNCPTTRGLPVRLWNSQCLGRRYFLWMGENCSLAGLSVHAPFTRLAIVKFRTAVFCIIEKVLVGRITNIITLSFHDDSSSWVEQTMLFAVKKKSILFFSTYYCFYCSLGEFIPTTRTSAHS